MYGPLLNGWKREEISGWRLKKREFSRAFFEHVVLAKQPPPSRRRPALAYWPLAFLRVLLAVLPPTGYLHPDEFFQTLDPVAGIALDVEWSHAWEFNNTFPLRNMMLPHLSIGIPLRLLKSVNPYLIEYLDINLITPYFLVVIPRLCYCLLSFVNDYSLLKICHLYGEDFNKKLIFMATSHVTLIYATHTFSNSLEIVLMSLLLLLVSECMLTSGCIIHHNEMLSEKYKKAENIIERVKLFKLKKLLPEYSLRKCLQIATVTVVGIFNRPTFVAFAFPSVFLWLLRGLGSKHVGFKDFHIRLFIFILSSLPALIGLILMDSFYYGYLTISDIESLEVTMNNFVVTPLNFLRYNLFSNNLAKHGLHPRWLHMLVNIPILFNVLSIVSLFSIVRICYRLLKGNFRALPRIQSLNGLMSMSIIVPLIILSVFPHQEPRFLIPLLLPMIFLSTQNVHQNNNDPKWNSKLKSSVFTIWCTCNLLLVIFFGFIHQGGMYQAANHIHKEVSSKPKFMTVHIVTSHMYNIPQSLLLTKDTSLMRFNRNTRQKYKLSKQLFMYELGSKPLPDVVKHVKAIWEVSEAKMRNTQQTFRLYLLLPKSLKHRLGNSWGQIGNSSLALDEEDCFYPHLSTEALPYFPTDNDPSCASNYDFTANVTWDIELTLVERFICFMKQFSLCLYKVEKYSYFFNA